MKDTAEAPQDTSELIDHIQSRYHDTHRRELPEIATLAEKVERVHHDHPQVPQGLGELLRRLIGEMEVHMKKEELILFPAMRAGGGPGIKNPIAVMRADHDDHEESVAEIRRITGNLVLPEGACRSWTALYEGTQKFLDDLDAHMRLENDVLFPRFE
ncbi:MAG: hemerythrin domain-containing protein [Rhodobacteraceae bacterium]|nr:hemerythrin domain-containing protein [Paracoccaceae bacterium]